MEETSKETILAIISQCVADRDKEKAIIKNILCSKKPVSSKDIHRLKRHFERLTSVESTIETIQIYYAQNVNINKKEDSKDDNNS